LETLNFNDFPENQLKANRWPKFGRYSFTQDSYSDHRGTDWIDVFHCHTLIYNYSLQGKNWNRKSLGYI